MVGCSPDPVHFPASRLIDAGTGVDVYPLRPADMAWKRITVENFEADTRRAAPWYQVGDDGKEAQYAVCPACDNPVQVIGLYRLPANVKPPFGRHVSRGVDGLAQDRPEDRACCPYFKPRPLDKAARRQRVDGLPRKILALLIRNFDLVARVVQQDAGVRFSNTQIRKMLLQYRAEQGYLYTGATLMNVPWVFAYMADAQPLFKQWVHDPNLAGAIRREVPAATLEADGRVVSSVDAGGRKQFVGLSMCFIHHRRRRDGKTHAHSESMLMLVSVRERDGFRDIFGKDIEFDHDRFRNLIRDRESAPDDRLIALADEVLGPIARGRA